MGSMKNCIITCFMTGIFKKILVSLLNVGERYIGHEKRMRWVISFYTVLVAVLEGKRPQSFVY